MKLHRFGRGNLQNGWRSRHFGGLVVLALVLSAALPLNAQGSPWENAVQVLQNAFTGPIARGLALVSIVIGGLMFAYGEGQSKRTLAGILFGVGMAIGAVKTNQGQLNGGHPRPPLEPPKTPLRGRAPWSTIQNL
jgi:type IV secretory pathway VirB2 component (pilin)